MIVPAFDISLYPFFFIGSFVIAFTLSYVILHIEGIPNQIIALNSILVLIMCLFGAMSFDVIRSGFSKSFMEAGFSSLGGAIGLLLAVLIMSFIYPQGKESLIRTFTLMIPLMYSISKLGCFFAGCCRGIPYTGFGAVRYNNQAVVTDYVFPIQLVESIAFLFIFLVGVMLLIKHNTDLVAIVMWLCAIGKFSLDFLREEHIGKVLTVNQIISMVFLIISINIYIISRAKKGDVNNGSGSN